MSALSMIPQTNKPEKASILGKMKLSELSEPICAKGARSFADLDKLFHAINEQIH